MDTVTAICKSFDEVERTVAFLHRSEVDLRSVSTLGLAANKPTEVVGFYLSEGTFKVWGEGQRIQEDFLASRTRVGLFVLPGLGPVLSSGPFLQALADAVEGRLVVGSSSCVGAALICLGVPRIRVLRYESVLKAKECLVIYHGPTEETKRVKGLLKECLDCVFVD